MTKAFKDVGVVKAQHDDAERREIEVAWVVVVLPPAVDAAVELDRELQRRIVEIDHVASDDLLPAKPGAKPSLA